MGFEVRQIDHVEVFVRDIGAAARWYERVLGLREVMCWDPEPLMIGAGGTLLALFAAEPGARDRPQAPIRWHRVAWRVDRHDFEAAQIHLRGLGIDFRGPIDHGRALSVYFEDPDGHPLEITCHVERGPGDE